MHIWVLQGFFFPFVLEMKCGGSGEREAMDDCWRDELTAVIRQDPRPASEFVSPLPERVR